MIQDWWRRAGRDAARARSYVLGRLGDRERSGLQQRFFDDAGTYELLREAETDLVDDYAASRLSPDDARRVEAHVRSSPDGRGQLRLARALMARQAHEPVRRETGRAWLAWAAAAAVVAAVAVHERPGRLLRGTPHAANSAALPQAVPSPSPDARPVRPPVVATATLFPIVMRQPVAGAEIRLPPDATVLDLRLVIDQGLTECTVTVRHHARGRVFQQGGLVVDVRQLVTVSIPRAALSAGAYEVLVSRTGSSGDAPVATYAFRLTAG